MVSWTKFVRSRLRYDSRDIPTKQEGYLPVQAVGPKNALLANHDVIRGCITHCESKPLDGFRYDFHAPGWIFQLSKFALGVEILLQISKDTLMATQPNGVMKIEVCYPDIWTPYGLRNLQMSRVGEREGCFRVLCSKEVDRMHGAVFIYYLREVTFESRL